MSGKNWLIEATNELIKQVEACDFSNEAGYSLRELPAYIQLKKLNEVYQDGYSDGSEEESLENPMKKAEKSLSFKQT